MDTSLARTALGKTSTRITQLWGPCGPPLHVLYNDGLGDWRCGILTRLRIASSCTRT